MKIVFFHEKNQKFSGGLLQYFNLTNYLSSHTDHEVYYVDCYNTKIAELVKQTQINYVDVNQFNSNGFDDAVFITPPNYLFALLEKIGQLKNAKILLYDWHSYSATYLKNQFKDQSVDLGAIYQYIDQKNGIAFMDEPTRLAVQNILDYLPQKRYIPVTKEINTDRYSVLKRKKKDVISVAYLGRLDADKIFSVINIADNLMNLECECPIEFHIIGDGDRRNLINLSQYAGKITFIFTSYLMGEDMYSYLRDHVDILITMGTALLNGAELGIPSVVVPLKNRRFYTNQYVFLHDLRDYTLGWACDIIPQLAYNFMSLDDIIEKALGAKEKHGQMCYQYIRDNHQIAHSADLCLKWAQQTQLTVKELLELPGIKAQWSQFCTFHEKTGKPYIDFQNRIVGQRAVAKKGHYARLRENTVKAFDHSVGKLQKIWVLHLNRKKYQNVHDHYGQVVQKLREKAKEGNKLRAAFLVLYTTTFPSYPIYKIMSEDSRFETRLIAIPDVQRGIKHLRETYIKTLGELKEISGEVIEGYDMALDRYLDIGDDFDLVFFNNPYKGMVNPVHSVEHFLCMDVLTFYVNYGFFTLKYGRNIVKQDFYNYVWKVFIDSNENFLDLKKEQFIRGKNAVVSGYIKMDDMANANIEQKERKRILICPHHTVSGWTGSRMLALSNFLKYSEVILELPEKYPELDFVFRPHPLLFYNLVSAQIWTEEEKDQYIEKLNNFSNMMYDTCGDYLETFANSDAMIHDCGSFTAEYLFTEKPCCYLLKDESEIKEEFLPMGQECLKHYYKAFNKEDIYRFIEDVVIHEIDPLKEKRSRFSKEKLKFNYPNSAKFACQYIADQLFLS